jgi:hypothetical protein
LNTILKLWKTLNPGEQPATRWTVIGFPCLLLLLLLPLNSFAQTHLLKRRPFRATDTEQSGGDHICDLRRDSNSDGIPDRLGGYAIVSGTVTAEPSTYERHGCLFWVRDSRCGIMIHSRGRILELGDSVEIHGYLRMTTGRNSFPEANLPTAKEPALECVGLIPRGQSQNCMPVELPPSGFLDSLKTHQGNLVTIPRVSCVSSTPGVGGDFLVGIGGRGDSVTIFVDQDAHCSLVPDHAKCYHLTGIVMNLILPLGFTPTPSLCIAPRSQDDIVPVDCSCGISSTSWGNFKAQFYRPD